MVDLTIIIVSWNCRDDLGHCLRSLETSGTRATVQTVVVDNDSGDDTVRMVTTDFPWVRIIANTENTGFAAANNQAMRVTKSRLVMLLNPDTTVDEGTLDAMIAYLDSHEEVWAAGPLVLNSDRSVQVSGYRYPSLANLVWEALFLDRLFPHSRLLGSHKQLYADPREIRAVDYVQGSALMVKRRAVEKVGALDEQFFMYFEETDWCFRMRQEGGEIHHAPVGTVVHSGAGAFGHFDALRLKHYHRSLLRFFRKHYSFGARAALRPILFARSLIRIAMWSVISVARPAGRRQALSIAWGYVNVLGILAGGT